MLELADIFQDYGPAYEAKYGERMPPSHHDALWDIAHCHTPLMGGEVYWCEHCQDVVYSYHSCGNRHSPKCGGDRADAWRDRQMDKLLPVPYFLVTFTLPHTLNPLARSHQKLFYTPDDDPPDETPRCCPHCGGPLAFVARFPRTPHRRNPP